jgi:flavodoxin II
MPTLWQDRVKMSDSNFKIGLFYGSTTCYTEMAAEKIQAALNTLFDAEVVDTFNIKDVSLSTACQFDILIFGISTWDFGELQEDWESCWADIRDLDLRDKTVALFGLGDQLGYTDWFQDALGMLHDELAVLDCNFIGYWPNQGYNFSKSKGLTTDLSHFVGLSLDDENQYELSQQRIEQWTAQLLEELLSLGA